MFKLMFGDKVGDVYETRTEAKERAAWLKIVGEHKLGVLQLKIDTFRKAIDSITVSEA